MLAAGPLKVQMTALLCVWYALAITATIGIPLGLAAWIRRLRGAAWRHLLYGALVLFVVQTCIRLPVVRMLQIGRDSQSIQHLAILAFSAGLLEEFGRWAGYRLLLRRDLNWAAGLMYGLGHGWAECLFVAALMALALRSFLALGELDTSAVLFSAEQLGVIRGAYAWWRPLVGSFERTAMLPIHMMLSLIVLRVFLTSRMRWLAAAVVFHAVLNLGIGLMMSHIGLLHGELFAAFFAVGSIITIRRLSGSMHPS